MAIKAVFQQSCDRCSKPIISKSSETGEFPVDKVPRSSLRVERDGEESVKFDDLCEKCQGFVDNLLDSIALSGKRKGSKDEATSA